MIAAAGMGVRLGRGQPKCLTPLGQRPLIAHLLDRLRDVPDVRVVVGFAEDAVMNEVIKLRRDVTFVRNPAYRTTTTLTSYWLGARHLTSPVLYLDADIWFEPTSFTRFLERCATSDECLIGVTRTKTVDAVYAHRDPSGAISHFSRRDVSPFEWANIAQLHSNMLAPEATSVYERLSAFLPLSSLEIEAYEIDRPEDLAGASDAYAAWAARHSCEEGSGLL